MSGDCRDLGTEKGNKPSTEIPLKENLFFFGHHRPDHNGLDISRNTTMDTKDGQVSAFKHVSKNLQKNLQVNIVLPISSEVCNLLEFKLDCSPSTKISFIVDRIIDRHGVVRRLGGTKGVGTKNELHHSFMALPQLFWEFV